jgi:hypothetical protein
MRNCVEMGKNLLAGGFVFLSVNAGNTKRPGVIFHEANTILE